MAEFLGKPRPTREDVSSYMRDQNVLVEYFLDEMKPKIHLTVEPELWGEFESALVKKFGKFSPVNVQKAAQEALREWVEKNLK